MFLKYNLFTIIWALIIFVLVLLPGQQMPDISVDYLLSIDKLAHVFVFLVLVLLMIIGFIKQRRYLSLKTNPVRYSLIISGGYSLLLEGMQFISSERMVELFDAVANLSGCIMGYFVFLLIYRI